MSIVALKNKSSRHTSTVSGGSAGFSLNGGRRNLGYIGKTSLVNSCNLCHNNPNVVKKTVVNYNNYISRKYECPQQYPNYWVKHMSADDFSQEKYIKDKSILYSQCVSDIIDSGVKPCCTYKVGSKYVKENNQTHVKTDKVISQGDYIQRKLMKREFLPLSKDRQHFPMYLNNNRSLKCGSGESGGSGGCACHDTILTVEEAIAKNYLSSNWMAENCS